ISVQSGVFGEFVAGLAEAADALSVAEGLAEPNADVGAMSMSATFRRTLDHIADARAQGARVVAGGEPPQSDSPGLFLRPTVVADAPDEALVMHEETFGPLVGVARFTELGDAITRANGAPSGR